MPPPIVKTVKEVIFWQYAKIISASAGMGKKNYGMIMSTYKKLCNGDIHWSTSVREWLLEEEQNDRCIYCGEKTKLTTEHLLPRIFGGEDIPDNVVRVCQHCNSSKGSKGFYEWKGIGDKDNKNRIAEGKYLKYLYLLHEKNGTLDSKVSDLCDECALTNKCIEEGHPNKLTVYCIEGCFLKKKEKKLAEIAK